MYDLVIVGAGPAGIFTALELLRKGKKEKIVIVEKGKPVEKRHCPKAETGRCMNCKPYCHITTGFSGAGAFSDGKLSLCYEVGGELPTLIGEEFAQSLIDYTDSIYLEFGADPHVEGIYDGEDIREIRKNAIKAGLKLVDCPIRHLGTEKAQEIYYAIQQYLEEKGVLSKLETCDIGMSFTRIIPGYNGLTESMGTDSTQWITKTNTLADTKGNALLFAQTKSQLQGLGYAGQIQQGAYSKVSDILNQMNAARGGTASSQRSLAFANTDFWSERNWTVSSLMGDLSSFQLAIDRVKSERIHTV